MLAKIFHRLFVFLGVLSAFFGVERTVLGVDLRDGPVASSSNVPIQTSADSMDFDQKTGEIIGRGSVVVVHDKTRLYADQVRVNSKTKDAEASGHVRLRQGVRQWQTDNLKYNFETGAMSSDKARIQMEKGLFVESQSVESEDHGSYIMKDSYVTTSDYAQPGYRLRAKTIILYPQKKISFRDVVLYVGKVPVFYFPYMVVML